MMKVEINLNFSFLYNSNMLIVKMTMICTKFKFSASKSCIWLWLQVTASFHCQKIASSRKNIRRMHFWLRLGAQGVTLSVRLSVCLSVRDKVLILLISGTYLQADFKQTSGWLQDDSESIKQAFREHSEGTQRILKSTQRAIREKEGIRLHHTVGA